MKYIVFLLFYVVIAMGEDLPASFFRAIHQVETGGRLGSIKGQRGELGPLQIRKAYWQDSRAAGKYEQCSDYVYSCRVVTAYLNRYGRRFVLARDYESLARIHNGGLNGYRNPNTKKYWVRVRKFLS